MIRKLGGIFFTVILIVSLCGCWDYREINDDSIVAGFMLDIGKNGNTVVTVELVDFSESQNGSGGKSRQITVEGDSLVDAISHGFSESSEYLYWNHATTVVVSKEYAKRGITELLDYIYRNSGITLSTNILVSNLGTAKEIFELDTNNSAIKSYAIRNIMSDSRYFEGITESNAYGIINDIVNAGIHPVIAVVTGGKLTEKKSIDVEGAALFYNDKLIGFVDSEDTAYLRILKNKMQDGYFDFTMDNGNVSCLIRDAKAEHEPVIEDGKMVMDVKFTAGYEVMGQNGEVNVSDKAVLGKLTETIKNEMEKRIGDVAKAIQSEFGTDVFGFGAAVKKKMPEIFKTLDWDEYFKDIEIRVTADIKEPKDDDQYPSIVNLTEKER